MVSALLRWCQPAAPAFGPSPGFVSRPPQPPSPAGCTPVSSPPVRCWGEKSPAEVGLSWRGPRAARTPARCSPSASDTNHGCSPLCWSRTSATESSGPAPSKQPSSHVRDFHHKNNLHDIQGEHLRNKKIIDFLHIPHAALAVDSLPVVDEFEI